MFTLDSGIDAVQNSKKQFVKTFVNDKTTANTLTQMVDAQTAYFKAMTKAATEVGTTVATETVRAVQELKKFTPAKFAESMMNK